MFLKAMSAAGYQRLKTLCTLLCLGTFFASSAIAQSRHQLSLVDNGGDPSIVDGSGLVGGLTLGSNGNFYGTAATGGRYQSGGVFELSPAGSLMFFVPFGATKGIFGVNSDGEYPTCRLIEGTDGRFYGVAEGGGLNGTGSVFKMSAAGHVLAIHPFESDISVDGSNSDGANPRCGLVQGTDGEFYGTASAGGAHDKGTVFKVTSMGSLRTLHSFGATSDGETPMSSLVPGPDGYLYGTTASGGANNCGTLYKISQNGAMKTLYSFNGPDGGVATETGSGPCGDLALGKDGNFYGTTSAGGGEDEDDCGTIFRASPDGKTTTIYVFKGVNTDGVTETRDGDGPSSGLIPGPDGQFYGTTVGGGEHSQGTVFKVSMSGAYSTLYSFDSNDGSGHSSSGGDPQAGLVVGADGNLWGTTTTGGIYGSGTIFKLTLHGNFTAVYAVRSVSGLLP